MFKSWSVWSWKGFGKALVVQGTLPVTAWWQHSLLERQENIKMGEEIPKISAQERIELHPVVGTLG